MKHFSLAAIINMLICNHFTNKMKIIIIITMNKDLKPK